MSIHCLENGFSVFEFKVLFQVLSCLLAASALQNYLQTCRTPSTAQPPTKIKNHLCGSRVCLRHSGCLRREPCESQKNKSDADRDRTHRERETEKERYGQRERDSEREREGQTDTDRHRQTQADTDRHRQTQTETETETEREREKRRDRESVRRKEENKE